MSGGRDWRHAAACRKALNEALNEQSTRSGHSWLTRSEVIEAVLPVIEANTVVVVHNIECPHVHEVAT